MSQHTTQESCDCPLSEDPFVQTVIRRKVRQLMVFPEFYPHEEEDLRQELLAQLDVGMKRHRAEVGHRNPFIVMVVDRKAANLLEYRRQQMRAEQNIGSLNVPATESDGKCRDRIHCISEDDQRRKLETSQLSRTEIVELRCDPFDREFLGTKDRSHLRGSGPARLPRLKFFRAASPFSPNCRKVYR